MDNVLLIGDFDRQPRCLAGYPDMAAARAVALQSMVQDCGLVLLNPPLDPDNTTDLFYHSETKRLRSIQI